MRAVEMQWRGQTYTIPATQAFQIGEQVEDILTLVELREWSTRPKMHKLARCFGVMLRFAGCKVADSVVYSEIMSSKPDANGSVAAMEAMNGLAKLLMGGATDGDGDGEAPEKTSAS